MLFGLEDSFPKFFSSDDVFLFSFHIENFKSCIREIIDDIICAAFL